MKLAFFLLVEVLKLLLARAIPKNDFKCLLGRLFLLHLSRIERRLQILGRVLEVFDALWVLFP
jgi:hypothetical protein